MKKKDVFYDLLQLQQPIPGLWSVDGQIPLAPCDVDRGLAQFDADLEAWWKSLSLRLEFTKIMERLVYDTAPYLPVLDLFEKLDEEFTRSLAEELFQGANQFVMDFLKEYRKIPQDAHARLVKGDHASAIAKITRYVLFINTGTYTLLAYSRGKKLGLNKNKTLPACKGFSETVVIQKLMQSILSVLYPHFTWELENFYTLLRSKKEPPSMAYIDRSITACLVCAELLLAIGTYSARPTKLRGTTEFQKVLLKIGSFQSSIKEYLAISKNFSVYPEKIIEEFESRNNGVYLLTESLRRDLIAPVDLCVKFLQTT
ncbi:hypothetical protein KA082_02645 [Candidatus Woesebacteria bacterium]|nr:hypothetical protein [Candidatus Woesebacteria bacterium]